MQYRNPKTGQCQDVGEFETVKRVILEQAGWRCVAVDEPGAAPAPVEAAPPAPVEDGPAPGFKRIDVTTHDSVGPEYIDVPDTEETRPARKIRK